MPLLPLPIVPLAIGPVTLSGRATRLEPLHERHAADLFAAATPETFSYLHLMASPWSVDGFIAYTRTLNADLNRVPFAIIHHGAAIGSTSYLGIRRNDQAVDIGTTWFAPQFRGTLVNPEIKFLMLRHAFETLKVQHVLFRADTRNVRSVAAIKKLGAVHEGTMRRDSIQRDGFCRDIAVFGVIPEEWPGIKARLIARLGYEP